MVENEQTEVEREMQLQLELRNLADELGSMSRIFRSMTDTNIQNINPSLYYLWKISKQLDVLIEKEKEEMEEEQNDM